MNMRKDHCNWDAQDQQQWQEAYHPNAEDEAAYQSWATKNQADQQIRFDLWLDSPEGHEWLDSEEERYAPTADYGYSWERQA